MKSVKNNQLQAVKVLRHTVMVDGRVTLPSGEIVSGMPDTLAHTSQVSQLVADGVLEVEGLGAPKKASAQIEIPLTLRVPEEPVEEKSKPKKRRK